MKAGAGVAVGFKDVAGLGAGASLATPAIVGAPADLAPGSYVFSAVADVDDAIPEIPGTDGVAANGRVAVSPISVRP
jgi:hypothetical protein